MKIDWNKKYNTIAAYILITVILGILFYLGLSNISKINKKISVVFTVLQPFIFGFGMAYVLNFVLKFYERNVVEKVSYMKKLDFKKKRAIGLVFTYFSVAILIYLFAIFVIPQLIESTIGLLNDIPNSITAAGNFIRKIINGLNLEKSYIDEIMIQWQKFINSIIDFLTNLLPVLAGVVRNVASSILNIVLCFIISIYYLKDKEKFIAMNRKVTCALFNEKKAKKIFGIINLSNVIFGKFIVGKLMDSLIVGIFIFIILAIVKIPYTLLISVIIGITNIIPFFGPFIGAVPSILIVLFVSPLQALWLAVIIVIVQQIDGNIIGPKILGDSIGISAFWILFALLIGGKIMGVIGMVIGVPIFAVIYTILKEIVDERLSEKKLPIKIEEYEIKD